MSISWSARRQRAFAALFPLLLLVTTEASAVKLRTEVSSTRVGVGQAFEVRLTAVVEDGDPQPASPQLQLRGGAEVSGPSISNQRKMMMHNFSIKSEESLVATWTVVPTARGKLVVGPPSFQVGRRRLGGETVTVEVVDTAQPGPPRRRRGLLGPDPSDIFGQDPFAIFNQQPQAAPAIPPVPAEYSVSHATDPISFLHVVVDKKEVVLGEPVRVTLLAYGSRGVFREATPSEPSFAEFLSYSVLENPHEEPTYLAVVDGTQYLVRKLREYVIVPLTTGSLTVGELSTVIQGNRGSYPAQGSPLGMRIGSPDLKIVVLPPPKRGMPDGYVPGDVGALGLVADVSPRALVQGEFAEVVVQIAGTGQLPSRVLLPESTHFVWEPPTMSGGPTITNGELQGTRVLKYSLQMLGVGEQDLGEVRLPYFDPTLRAYQVARVDLGTIVVAPGKKPAPTLPMTADGSIKSPGESKDASLPILPRKTLGTSQKNSQRELPDAAWWALLGLPAVVFLVGKAADGLRLRREKSKTRSQGQHKAWLKEAEKALQMGDPQSAVTPLERALYDSLDRATGARCRGFLRDNLERELKGLGLPGELALRAQALLQQLEHFRYAKPESGMDALLEASQKLTSELDRHEKLLQKRTSRAEGAP